MIMLLMSLVFSPIIKPIQTYFQFHTASHTTPIRELKKSHKVTHGFMCWHPMEVKCIDEVCGDGKKSYWIVKVNGDSLHFNGNSHINPSDLVEWEYVSSKGI